MIGINNEVGMRSKKKQEYECLLSSCNALRYKMRMWYNSAENNCHTGMNFIVFNIFILMQNPQLTFIFN